MPGVLRVVEVTNGWPQFLPCIWKSILKYHGKGKNYCKTQCNGGRNHSNLISKQQFTKLSSLLSQSFCQSYGFGMFQVGRIAI